MSAYICNPSHIAYVAVWSVAFNSFDTVPQRVEKARQAAEVLAKENIRSVAHRYPNDKDGERPGPCLTDKQIVDLSVLWADHYSQHRYLVGEPVQAIKLCQTYDYQACECDDYETSQAARLVRQAQYAASRKLVGYEQARHEWSDQEPPGAIRAYIEGEAA